MKLPFGLKPRRPKASRAALPSVNGRSGRNVTRIMQQAVRETLYAQQPRKVKKHPQYRGMIDQG